VGTRADLSMDDCSTLARRLSVEVLNSVGLPSRPPLVIASGLMVRAVYPISTGSISALPSDILLGRHRPMDHHLTRTAGNLNRSDIRTVTAPPTQRERVCSARPILPPSDYPRVLYVAGPFWNDTTRIPRKRTRTIPTGIDTTVVTRSRTAGSPVGVSVR